VSEQGAFAGSERDGLADPLNPAGRASAPRGRRRQTTAGRAQARRGRGSQGSRGHGRREDLRLLLLERRGAMHARTAALNQLSALVVTAPEHVREQLGALSGERLAQAAARLRPRAEVINAFCVGSATVSSDSRRRSPSPSAHSPRSSPSWRPSCSRSVALDPSAPRNCSSNAATPAGSGARPPSPRSRARAGRCLERQATTPPAEPRR
jgi:hypothetical protein